MTGFREKGLGVRQVIKITVLALIAVSAAFLQEAASRELADSDGLFNMERRRDQYLKDFGYFIYPIAGKVPGLGTAVGGGATVTNIEGTDTDFTGFYVQGDFDAAGAALLNIHLLPEKLILNSAYYQAKVAPQIFRRGIDSDRSDYFLPEYESDVAIGQLTLTFFERMLEVYARYANGSDRLKRVLDKNGNEFSNIDTGKNYFQTLSMGISIDITDDNQDPRKGIRIEVNRNSKFSVRDTQSRFDLYDYNVTGYLPVGTASSWAFNMFFSDPVLQSAGTTDRNELKKLTGLQCGAIADPAEKAKCDATENRFLDDAIANNRYGRATSLGGTQRLRSYPNSRFYAGHSIFFGTEFRWNLTEEETLMDWYILRGLRTNLQLAFFAGLGSVADSDGNLLKKMRSSYGVGFRVIFIGATIRMDYAFGDEGSEMQMFLDYPWSMFSIDNPT